MGKVAAEHVPRFVKRVQQGRDYEGRTFKGYTSKYAEYKSRGMKGKRGKKLKAFKGVSITSKKINPPDLTVTKLTLRNLKARKWSDHEYTIGWDGEAAEIVEGLSKKRDIISGIPDSEFNWVVDRLLEEGFDKPWKKIKNVKIRVGK